jgi:hypothetical protein
MREEGFKIKYQRKWMQLAVWFIENQLLSLSNLVKWNQGLIFIILKMISSAQQQLASPSLNNNKKCKSKLTTETTR